MGTRSARNIAHLLSGAANGLTIGLQWKAMLEKTRSDAEERRAQRAFEQQRLEMERQRTGFEQQRTNSQIRNDEQSRAESQDRISHSAKEEAFKDTTQFPGRAPGGTAQGPPIGELTAPPELQPTVGFSNRALEGPMGRFMSGRVSAKEEAAKQDAAQKAETERLKFQEAAARGRLISSQQFQATQDSTDRAWKTDENKKDRENRLAAVAAGKPTPKEQQSVTLTPQAVTAYADALAGTKRGTKEDKKVAQAQLSALTAPWVKLNPDSLPLLQARANQELANRPKDGWFGEKGPKISAEIGGTKSPMEKVATTKVVTKPKKMPDDIWKQYSSWNPEGQEAFKNDHPEYFK